MYLYWIIFAVILICALLDCKRTIIVWMPLQLLFNSMVALKFSSPVLSLSIAVNFILPVIFFIKYGFNKKRYLNNEPFFFKTILILYIISYLLSLLFSIAPFSIAVNDTARFFVKNFVMVYLFQRCLNDKNDLKLFVRSVVIIGILIAALGLVESVIKHNPVLDYVYFAAPNPGSSEYFGRMWYTPPFLSESGLVQMRYGLVRAYSFFNIHIAFGVACLFLAFMLAVLLKNKCYIINKRILWLSLILLLTGVFTANSKTGMVGLAIMLLAFFSIKQIFNIKILVGAGIVLGIILIYFPDYILNYISIFDADVAAEGGGSTVEMRKEQLEVALRLFEMNPIFGNGVSALQFFKGSSIADGILGAESCWMQILPERGLLGAFVYIYWYVYTFKNLKKVVPVRVVLFFLIALLVMETATGILDMALYGTVIIAVRRFYMLQHIDTTNRLITTNQNL